MIRCINVCKTFDDREVLSNIDTTFEKGKTNLIIGQSGSGKTVLLKCMVGLHEVTSGDIMYSETNFSALSNKQRSEERKKIGMIFQGGALFDFATVEGNVLFPLNMFTNMSEEEKLDRANFCLRRVNLINVNHLYPSQISGGMQKRVAIARAIALNPKYLFCDEPNSGLDPITAGIIDNLIKELTIEYDITTIINTHDMNSVMQIGDKVMFIHEGKKWWEGSKDDILDSDNPELNKFVFASEMAQMVKKYHNRLKMK
ncbi:ABC transporter ATP-binding protein [Acetobacteroides hydrogenigenes]|uniref:Phospholipid/cholesterol/gamma-HCH transport system ATP-binding protein n=1 Tax=Acetobacteroides hydrogenigenes TaxID=979970 RepID=A0A4R2E5X0_9BACT|nr:ATP-binding cassette domain-containing protein [Acetobacteroides hydrogenigenes]TCN62096.1 phospholipid/cholesterol/gamma-HCH transport system ATP-binding protein [Acetobacteroides hydrogenigenes]